METVCIVLTLLVLLHAVAGPLVNVALHKPVRASSMRPDYNASTAVDGHKKTTDGVDSIIDTGPRHPFAWWKVDLQTRVQDALVRIYFRTDFKKRRNGVELYTSLSEFILYPGSEDQLCDTVTGRKDGYGIPDVYNVTCPGTWRYLLIYTNTSNNDEGPVLDFGEVEVYELPPCPNFYGLNCDKLCSSRKCKAPSTSSCDRLSGKCPGGCEDGWRQEDCTQKCESSYYGASCGLPCKMRHCLGSSLCDHVTGQCIGGCQAGYTKMDCRQPCDYGSYGSGCNSNCSDRKCFGLPTVCNHGTGKCVNGCQFGYKGVSCIDKCEAGTYGYKCSHNCRDRSCLNSSSQCDHVTGQCVGGCQAGYNGTDCRQACSNVTYGVNCEKFCMSRHCMKSPSTCDPKTGQCHEGCEPGWRESDCASQCPNGTYGSNCTSCTTRHCQGVSDCPSDGTCSQGCKDGWTGNNCTQKCQTGYYGPRCRSPCGNCSSGPVCDHVNGKCMGGCKPGWRTNQCHKVCMVGYYGLDCAEKCGKCDGVCDSVDGRCPTGCLEGYNGTKCDEALPAASTGEPSYIVVPAAAGTVVALVAIVIIIVMVILFRRRRKSQGSKPNQEFDRPTSNSAERNNVYVNVQMEAIPKRKKEIAQQPYQVKPPITSHDDEDDQSEEILDEDEAPTSTPYYNIDEEDVIREVAVEDLAATVQKIKSREGGFEAEYNRLPTGFTATYADSQKKENTGKNKFIGYYPYDYNRVRLSHVPDVPGSDYINASIVHNINETKTYIAAQAPKKKTVYDFWRMIWEQRCGRVVMLTGLVEDSKVKCYQYWPENNLLTTDLFRVGLEDTNTRANYTVRTLKVLKLETGESRKVVQYHYTTWPDHGVPDTLALVNFIWMIRRTHTRTDGPLLVHCSAGVGRTGTYIAVDALLDQAREEGKVDVQGYVSIMRGQRKNMIQTTHQYECVFSCLVEMTKYGNTSLAVDEFTKLYDNSGMDARVDSDGKTFRELAQIMTSEQTTGSPIKNRMWVDGNQGFIVRSAPSLRSVRGHLLCESPHPGQEKLLWKLVEENNVNNVIVLAKTQADFVGEKGSSKTFGNIKLLTTDQNKLTSDLSLSQLLLQQPSNENKQKLQLFKFLEPVSVESLSVLLLENSRLKLMMSELSSRVVVHSCTKRKVAVMFCMLGNLVSEIQEDETVDVLHQVRIFTRIFTDIKFAQDDVKQLFNFARRCAHLTASTYANM